MAKIRTGQIKDDSEAWSTWVPTYTNFSLGNGTVSARYKRIGTLVHFRIRIVFGSTTAFTGGNNDMIISLPVASVSTGYTQYNSILGSGIISQSGNYLAALGWFSTTEAIVYNFLANSTYVQQNNTDGDEPVSFTTGASIDLQGFYEVAP